MFLLLLFALVGLAQLAVVLYGVGHNIRVSRENRLVEAIVISTAEKQEVDANGKSLVRRFSTIEARHAGRAYSAEIDGDHQKEACVRCLLDTGTGTLRPLEEGELGNGVPIVTAGMGLFAGLGLVFLGVGTVGLAYRAGMPFPHTETIVLCVAAFLAGGFAVYGGAGVFRRLSRLGRYTEVQGEIVQMNVSYMYHRGRRRACHSPVFRFTHEGRTYNRASAVATTSRKSWRPGDAVRILFRPDTEEAELRLDFRAHILADLAFFLGGLVFLAAFLLALPDS